MIKKELNKTKVYFKNNLYFFRFKKVNSLRSINNVGQTKQKIINKIKK